MRITKYICALMLGTMAINAWAEVETYEKCTGTCGESLYVNWYQAIPIGNGRTKVTCERQGLGAIDVLEKQVKQGKLKAAPQKVACQGAAEYSLQSACAMYGNSIQNLSCAAYNSN